MTEWIRFPYSFFSQEGHEKIIDKLHNMGYRIAKIYPGD